MEDKDSDSDLDGKSSQDEELIRLALRNSPFFSCLDEEQMDRFVARSVRQRYNTGDVIISEGCVNEKRPDLSSAVELPIDENKSTTGEDAHAPENDTMGQLEEHTASDELVVDGPIPDPSTADAGVPSTDELGAEEINLETAKDAGPQPVSDSDVAGPRSVYIIRNGKAGVWYQPSFNPATLGPGQMFGEGGFLFGRQHSASIIAKEPVECWIVDLDTFRKKVLPSTHQKALFEKFSTGVDERGAFMSYEEFLRVTTDQLVEHQNNQLDSVLFNLRLANAYSALQGETVGRIYLEDFCFLHLLVLRPGAEVDIVFLLIDERHTGQLFLTDLKKFFRPVFPDLNYDSAFFDRYFGKDHSQSIRQVHFSQFFVDLQREIGKQAFLKAADENGTNGYLEPSELVNILKSSCGWRLSRGVIGRLEEVFCREQVDWAYHSVHQTARDPREEKFFSYGDFLAFQEVLGNLPFICNLIEHVQEIKEGSPVSPDDFKVANQVLGLGDRFSRRQVEIVFRLFDLDQDGYVTHDDTVEVCGVDYARRLVVGTNNKLSFTPVPRSFTTEETPVLPPPLIEEPHGKSLKDYFKSGMVDFFSAAVFGGIAAGILYPLDIVKTRMMNQRYGSTILYRHSFDCLQQAIRHEGIAGLYRGITPQLLCIAPERAIKLQVHDLVRETIGSFDNNNDKQFNERPTNLWADALAGGCAGASQILVTNPLEISKIRLQMQGETHRVLKARGIIPLGAPNFDGVVRALGFPGVYKGASACLLRDIPFSAIYFPSYVALKDHLANSRELKTAESLTDVILAATMAAIPASILTTPADVVKSRLQSIARPGEVPYHGIRDCIQRIYQEEGMTGFFRGTGARVLRISPQFGITMLAYEGFVRGCGFSPSNRPPVCVPISPLNEAE